MTATEPTAPDAPDTWDAQLEQLRARYKHVREPILVALNILLHDPNIAVDDAKAQANLHGVKITAASVSAAKRLLARMDDKPAESAATTTPATNGVAPAPQRPTRRVRPADQGVDAEALIRQVVGKIQGQGNAEVERMREGIRRAVAILQGLAGS